MMAIPAKYAGDYAVTDRILKEAFDKGEYHCKKPRCKFKTPNSLAFLEHLAIHVNEFCERHGLPKVKAIAIDGEGNPLPVKEG